MKINLDWFVTNPLGCMIALQTTSRDYPRFSFSFTQGPSRWMPYILWLSRLESQYPLEDWCLGAHSYLLVTWQPSNFRMVRLHDAKGCYRSGERSNHLVKPCWILRCQGLEDSLMQLDACGDGLLLYPTCCLSFPQLNGKLQSLLIATYIVIVGETVSSWTISTRDIWWTDKYAIQDDFEA